MLFGLAQNRQNQNQISDRLWTSRFLVACIYIVLKAIGARDGDREMAAGAGDARAKTRQADVDAKGGDGTRTRGD